MERSRSLSNAILIGVGTIAALELLLFWSFVLRARLDLGYWPSPYLPDPKTTGFVLHGWAIFFGYLASGSTFILSPGWVALILFYGRRPNPIAAAYAAGALAAVVFTIFVDPGRYVEWFLD